MKKVKYNGDLEALIPTLSVVVKKGDIIEVPDDFFNVDFEEVKDNAEDAKSKGGTK